MKYKTALSVIALLLAASESQPVNAIQMSSHLDMQARHKVQEEPSKEEGKEDEEGPKEKLDVCARYDKEEKEGEKEEKKAGGAAEEEPEEESKEEEKGAGGEGGEPAPVPLDQEKLLENTPKYIAEETARLNATQKRLAKEVKAFVAADAKAFKDIDKKIKETCQALKKAKKAAEGDKPKPTEGKKDKKKKEEKKDEEAPPESTLRNMDFPAADAFKTVQEFQALLDKLRNNVDDESKAILEIYSAELKKRPPTTVDPKGTSIKNLKTVAATWNHKRFDIQLVLHKIGTTGEWLMDSTWWDSKLAQNDQIIKAHKGKIKSKL